MSIRIVVKKNTYFDSVSLMSISTRANKLDGVEQAFVAMATEMNKGVLKNLGLLTPELEEAKSGDLMIVIKGASEAANNQTLVAIEDLFTHKEQGGQHEARYATLASAKKHVPDSNLAVISVNGLFAAREARQALQNNLNVMLFSDNVSLEDELALKQLAHEKGLLMMGPDCGTAIINGAALCFGNAVRRGNIGIVGASGTGSQELSVRIHEFGGGISQLIGTGGRDLSEKIGGLMIPDKEEGSLPGNLSDPFPAALFSYGYVGMEVLPPQQVPGQTDRSSFLPHQRRTSDHLWNPAFLCVFRNDSCSLCVPVRSAARCSHSGYPVVPAS